MKILNAYAGIGGNRKKWGNKHEIVAVENDPKIAAVYKDYFSCDKIIVNDAHLYIQDNYKEFDFIWSSPPCPTHSRLNTLLDGTGRKMAYPDMTLYQEIIFLSKWFGRKFVVENVVPYYQPLIPPTQKLDRHFLWSNFEIDKETFNRPLKITTAKIKDYEAFLGYDLKNKGVERRKCLRNCVIPELGRHVLNCAIKSSKR